MDINSQNKINNESIEIINKLVLFFKNENDIIHWAQAIVLAFDEFYCNKIQNEITKQHKYRTTQPQTQIQTQMETETQTQTQMRRQTQMETQIQTNPNILNEIIEGTMNQIQKEWLFDDENMKNIAWNALLIYFAG